MYAHRISHWWVYFPLMPIDGCRHDFQQLASEILPADMARMRTAMTTPIPMRTFCKGAGIRTILKKLGRTADFPGCYLLVDGSVPFYVGISRGIVGRLMQHVRGRTDCDASFAYRMAKTCQPHEMERKEAMLNPDFRAAFDQSQERIRAMDVAMIEVENDLELYLFEVYCALELRTVEHNTFRTH
jgi:hypothetical protein